MIRRILLLIIMMWPVLSLAQDELYSNPAPKAKIVITNDQTVLSLKYKDNEGQTQPLNLPLEDGKIVFSEICDIEGVSAKNAYQKARIVIANLFVSTKDVTQLEDEDNLTLIIKGWYSWLKNPEALIASAG